MKHFLKRMKFMVAFLATMISGNMLGQTITANDVVIEPGGTADVTFTINADTKAAIAEFKLTLPKGVVIQFDEDEDDYVYELGKSMTVKTHSATIKKQENGDFYVLVSNSAGKEFKAASGDIITLTLEASVDAVSGNAVMKNIILGDINAFQMNTVTEATFAVTVGGTTPDNPDDPTNPDNPDNPTNPDNPSNPDDPATPDNPDTPVTPVYTGTITGSDVSIERGKTADVTFSINAEAKAAIAEFKLTLPKGVEIKFDADEDDYVYELGSDMTVKTHSATIKKQDNGDYYVLVSNASEKEFKAESGAYLTVTLEASANAESGTAVMKEIILGDLAANQMNTVTQSTFTVTVSGEVTPDNPENPENPENPDNPDTSVTNSAVFTASNVSIEKGKTANVTFTITADKPVAIAEFKLSLPKGVSILFDENEDDYVYELNSDMTVKTHSATIKKQVNGDFYVLVSNSAGKEFKAATGDLLTLTLTADAYAESGDAVVKNIILGDIDAKQINTVTETTFAVAVSGEVTPENPDTPVANGSITASSVSIEPGKTADVTFSINADGKAAIAEFKLVLPNGIDIKYNAEEDDYVYALGADMTVKTHTVTIKKQEEGSYYVLVSNASNKEFKAESGDYLTLTLVASANAVSGTAVMKDIILGDINANQMNKVTQSAFAITVNSSTTPDTSVEPVGGPMITANDVIIKKGQTADVTFTINAETKAAIAEFKLTLPKGVTVKFDADEDDYVYELGSSMTVKTHSATIKQQENGDFYVLISNSAGKEFKAASGDIITLTLEAAEDAESGVAVMKGIILGDIDAKQMNTVTQSTFDITISDANEGQIDPEPEEPQVLAGDVNGDSEVNITDVAFMINYILGKPTNVFVKSAADLNNDGEINITDVALLINIILHAK